MSWPWYSSRFCQHSNNMHWSHKNLNLSAHHHYQYAVIFLFIFGFFLFFPFYIFVKEFKLDAQTWQWYFFWPWMAFYIIYCLKQRRKILPEEEISPLKRHIGHWVLLGLSILMLQLQPNDLKHLYSVDYAFIIFSIFLADGYWDFRKLPRIFGHR